MFMHTIWRHEKIRIWSSTVHSERSARAAVMVPARERTLIKRFGLRCSSGSHGGCKKRLRARASRYQELRIHKACLADLLPFLRHERLTKSSSLMQCACDSASAESQLQLTRNTFLKLWKSAKQSTSSVSTEVGTDGLAELL